MTENKVWLLVLSDKKPPKHTEALYNVEEKPIPDFLKMFLYDRGWIHLLGKWYVHHWDSRGKDELNPQPCFYEGDTYFKHAECMKELGELYGENELIFFGFTLFDTDTRKAMGVNHNQMEAK